MNVIFVSQCHKNALKQTRLILDQFAERCGDRTWQTPITAQGLQTIRSLLRNTARKNTAVACHWIRGKNHTELLWIIGKASAFNSWGAVPTDSTTRDVLRLRDENDWRFAAVIRHLSALAALFHDLGKATVTFCLKLESAKAIADPFRHEWVSLRIFEAFVGPCDTDRQWLERLASLVPQAEVSWLNNLRTNGTDDDDRRKPPRELKPLEGMPLLARVIGWLIISHHRLPINFSDGRKPPNKGTLERLPANIYAHWCGSRAKAEGLSSKELGILNKTIADTWCVKRELPFYSEPWRKRATKIAHRILGSEEIMSTDWFENPYVLHMARLVLMLADHHYSRISNLNERVKGQPGYPLYANTVRATGALNQKLDEHLIGVEKHSGRIIGSLLRLPDHLPRIARHRGFNRRNDNEKFKWQDKAFDLARSLRTISAEEGFFGINMASTGCGKTLANGRIMYALADPQQGARFSIALGLRTLTLQTGDAYRQRLSLDSDVMAVLVGGAAAKQLHRLNSDEDGPSPINGSQSSEALLPDNAYVHYEGSLGTGPLASWLENTRGVEALVNAPILVSTIDHLIPATEGIRGGRQIAPMLRLMSSDLILDEPDDFDTADLYALSRLVHWSGMLGSRVLLSSATLPPAIIMGLFNAYRAGRAVYRHAKDSSCSTSQICCAWFDEYNCQAASHDTMEAFADQHRKWAEDRVEALANNGETRRRAYISAMALSGNDDEITQQFAVHVLQHADALHQLNHSIDPRSGSRVSFGLVRMANIDPLIDVALAISTLGGGADFRIHLCCYHARHPLLVRSYMERRLDQLLNRKIELAVFDDPGVRAILDTDKCANHLFMVLATPVAEVGRDHDYDWAIVEPSSVRSMIQLAGRVRRHRPEMWPHHNICLLGANLKHLKNKGGGPVFTKPGFETKHFFLNSHQLDDLLEPEQYERISSAPRILERPEPDPRNNLADLEHEHLRAVMLGDAEKRKSPIELWWTTKAHLSGELQRAFPFRYDPVEHHAFTLMPDENELGIEFKRIEQDGCLTDAGNEFLHLEQITTAGVDFLMTPDYLDLLGELAERLDMDLPSCARKFGLCELPVKDGGQIWNYHPALGFQRHK